MSRDPKDLTPREFETLVKEWFEATGHDLDSFKAQHLEHLSGVDGDYTIDVTVRFSAFDQARFLVLAECKRHKHPIKRSVVEVLHSRVQATGAHKGFVFATTSFQKGALEYAEKHGIALVEVVPGKFAFIQMSGDRRSFKLPDDYPVFAGFCMDPSLGPLPLLISDEQIFCLSQLLDDMIKKEKGA